MPARSSSVASSGAVASSRCCLRVPSTRSSTSPSAYPTAPMPVGDVDVAHQVGEHLREEVAQVVGPGRTGGQELRGADVPLGVGLEREPERLGRGQGHRHAVRHHRLVVGVAHRDGSPGRGPRSGRRWRAGCARRRCRSPSRRTWRPGPSARGPASSSPWWTEVRNDVASRLIAFSRPHVADRVRAAVGHPLLGRLAVVGVEGPRGPALQRVAEDVHAAGRGDAGRLGEGQPRVHDGEGRAQARVADPALHVLLQHVEHAHRGALAAGAGGGGHGDQRRERVLGGAAPRRPAR